MVGGDGFYRRGAEHKFAGSLADITMFVSHFMIAFNDKITSYSTEYLAD